MKQKIFFIFQAFLLFSGENLFSQRNIFLSDDKYENIFLSDGFKLQENQYLYNLKSLEGWKFTFFPSVNVSSSFDYSGTKEKGFNELSFDSCIELSEKLPGGSVLYISGNVPFSSFSEYDYKTWNFESSAGLRIPFVFGKKFQASYTDFLYNRWKTGKRNAENSYRASRLEVLKNYIEGRSGELYYGLLEEVLEKRLELETQKLSDCEMLFSEGKLSAQELSEKSLEKLETLKALNECRSSLFAAEKHLLESGFVPEKKLDGAEKKGTEYLEAFLNYWLCFYEENFSSVFYSEQLSEDAVLMKFYGFLEDEYEDFPFLSAEFSYVPEKSVNGSDLDFSSGKMSFSMSLNFTAFPEGFTFNENRKTALYKKNCELEMNIEKLKNSRIREERILEKNRLFQNMEMMKESWKIEEEKSGIYERLSEQGKISCYDSAFQKNGAELAELYYLQAFSDYVTALYGMY